MMKGQLIMSEETAIDAAKHAELLHEAETTAFPAVFRGLNCKWPAVKTWAGPEGLSYLKAVAGRATVQAMYAPNSNFFGNIEEHTSVACILGELMDIAIQQQQQQQKQLQDEQSTAAAAAAAAAGPEGFTNMNLYLAQQSLQEEGLSVLLQDVPTPHLLLQKQLTSINMWFSSRSSRSSTHYDPYQNLLCVITGSKQVRLFRPDAVLGLYPRALGGEASNHSSVDFANPDYAQHPLYRHALDQCIDVELFPGDALFIPEGWWHQVDSDSMTFAVNFWWTSDLTAQLRSLPHQHHYYLRQLLAATSSEVVQQLLAGIKPWTPPPAAAAQGAELQAAAATAGKAADEQGSRCKRSRTADAAVLCGDTPAAAAAAAIHNAPVQAGTAAAAAGVDKQHVSDLGTQYCEPHQLHQPHIAGAGDAAAAAACENTDSTNSSSSSSSSGDDGSTSSSSLEAASRNECIVLHVSEFEAAALAELKQAIVAELGPAENSKMCSGAAAHSQARQQQQLGISSQASAYDSKQQQQQQQQQQPGTSWGSTQLCQQQQQRVQQCNGSLVDASAAQAAVAGSGSIPGHIQSVSAAHCAAAAAARPAVSGVLVSGAWFRQQQLAQQQMLAEAVSYLDAAAGDLLNTAAAAAACNNSSTALGSRTTATKSSTPAADNAGLDSSSWIKQQNSSNTGSRGGSTDMLGLSSRVSRVLAALEPVQLLRVLWVAAGAVGEGGCSSTVRQLLEQGLTPAVAQILPQKFEIADEAFASDMNGDIIERTVVHEKTVESSHCASASAQQYEPEEYSHDMVMQQAVVERLPFTREQFYARLYGTVPDPSAVLHGLVLGKARLAQCAADLIVQCHMSKMQ